MTEFVVVFVTVSSLEEGKKIASTLLEERLVACVNIIPSINSLYHWQGNICDDEEILLIIKTRAELFEKLQEKVKSIHSYKVPEIIALPIVSGSQSYLDWIKEETVIDK